MPCSASSLSSATVVVDGGLDRAMLDHHPEVRKWHVVDTRNEESYLLRRCGKTWQRVDHNSVRSIKGSGYIQRRGWFQSSLTPVDSATLRRHVADQKTWRQGVRTVWAVALGLLGMGRDAIFSSGTTNMALASAVPCSTAGMGLPLLATTVASLSLVAGDAFASQPIGGQQFQINPQAPADERVPTGGTSVAVLVDGGFVAAWQSDGMGPHRDGVYGRRYDAMGQTVGSVFHIDIQNTASQIPSLAALTNGGFVLAWSTSGGDGSSDGVFAQRYDATGLSVGGVFQVNTYSRNEQSDPRVAQLASGDFVVVWQSSRQHFDIYGQHYNLDGERAGGEFRINTQTFLPQFRPSLAAFSNGGFVVVWQSNLHDGDGYGIYGQRFGAGGQPLGGEFRVNSFTPKDQTWPDVAALPGGGFVVVWQSDVSNGSYTSIYGQRYNSNGEMVGGEFRVNTRVVDDLDRPRVATLANGGFVVTWQSITQNRSSWAVRGQIYDMAGQSSGSEFQINNYTASFQGMPSVAGLPNGGFIVVWRTHGQVGSGQQINGRIFQLPPSPVPTTLPTAAPTLTPTPQPTPQPTPHPTFQPTPQPTTKMPTAAPTFRPTPQPTTRMPSAAPTPHPTPQPTTRSPTRSPTVSPTWQPTLSPSPTTSSPTGSPVTAMPTGAPSFQPSASPTFVVPTSIPMQLSPTRLPSPAPTLAPVIAGGSSVPSSVGQPVGDRTVTIVFASLFGVACLAASALGAIVCALWGRRSKKEDSTHANNVSLDVLYSQTADGPIVRGGHRSPSASDSSTTSSTSQTSRRADSSRVRTRKRVPKGRSGSSGPARARRPAGRGASASDDFRFNQTTENSAPPGGLDSTTSRGVFFGDDTAEPERRPYVNPDWVSPSSAPDATTESTAY